MKINIVHGDIFSISCDAYVNPTDIHLSGSGGLDKIIHSRGGSLIEQECISLRSKMKSGGTEITSGGNLSIKYILHTVCPKCTEETDGNYSLLAKCYHDVLSKAATKADLHHLALPLVGTGISGYSLHSPYYADTPYSLTAVTILAAIICFQHPRLHTVTIVCSSKEKYDIMQRTFRWITGRGTSKRSRIRGSLLGGAIGDALGYPVEFNNAVESRIEEYRLDQQTGTALISDDTQMTLFTACGLLWGYSRICMRGIGGDLWSYIAFAYEDWLKTQCPDYQKKKQAVSWIRNIPELNARRAPGMTCLSALQAGGGSICNPINNSKGCGGVMRIAPIALYSAANHHWDQRYNMTCCAETAALTHGHPLGWLSAAALGNILFDIMQNFSLAYAVQDTVLLLKQQYASYPDTETMVALLQKSATLASRSGHSSSYNLMAEYEITKQLGEGWVGEEALAIGLFCAFACMESGFDQCVHNAVWHKGDSDSTASIAGQIYGAYFGEEAIPKKWLDKLELREIIKEIADDLTNDCQMEEYSAYYDAAWVRKYLSGEYTCHIAHPKELPPHIFIQAKWPEDNKFSRTVYKYDAAHNIVGEYQVLIEDGIIYHVSQNKNDVQTESPGFGFVSLKYDQEKHAYTERHGWVKLYHGNTVEGFYNNFLFKLIPDFSNRCVEVFTNVSPNPWIGTIRRKFNEWDNPIEFEFQGNSSAGFVCLLEIIISSNEYLRDFFK